MADAPRATPGLTFALAAVIGALTALAVFHGGGSGNDTMLSVGLAVAVVVAVASVAVCLGWIPVIRPTRAGWLVLGGAALLTVWIGCSLVWSITPDVSWSWLNRSLVYFGFLLLGVLLGGLDRGRRAVVAVLTIVVAAAVGWALLGVAIPSLAPTGDRIARLSAPVGYWNALALLADMGLVLGLAVASVRGAIGRVAGLLLVYGSVVVLLLTQSRGGVIVGVAMLVVWLWRSRRRLVEGLELLLALVPGIVVAGWAFTRDALVNDDVGRQPRVDDGKLFALVFGLGAAIVLVAALRAPLERLVDRDPARARHALGGAFALIAIVGLVGFVAAVGNPVSWLGDQVSTGECANSPDRLDSLCDNNRIAWWGDALAIARANPLAGTGAGTYVVARLRFRDEASRAPEPHSLPLQILADLGLVGLALGGMVVVGAVGVGRRALVRAEPDDVDATTLLVVVALGYGLHALIDYDADFLAVTAPFALVLGALVAAAAAPARSVRLGVSTIVGVVAISLATIGSLALPELAVRAVDRGYAALDEGDLVTAARKARDARSLNPLWPRPIVLQSDIAAEADDQVAAAARLREAAELQPENPDGWVALGLYLYLLTPPDLCGAYYAFNAAWTLDPHGPAGEQGGPLDITRDAVNRGACER